MRPSDAVREFLLREGISGVSVCCAFSGGADSLCLLRCLWEQKAQFGLELTAVHIQHGLRGEESRRDENYCRMVCEAWDIPLTVISADVQSHAQAHHLSTETAARECRYAAFETLPCDLIATAHTASDQLETVLFRMARGTGLKGLCGIPKRRGRYIRPLLAVTRREIEDFLEERDIPYMTDSTNLSDDYSRNRIRHHIVPELLALNSGAEQNAVRMTETLSEDAAYLEAQANRCYAAAMQADGSLAGIGELPSALQRRCLMRFLTSQSLPCGYEAVAAVQSLLSRGGRLDLDRSGTLLRYSRGVLYVEKPQAIAEKRLVTGENQLYPNRFVHAEVMDREKFELFASVHKKFTIFALDYDIIKGYAKLHGRKAGLRMKPDGRNFHVSVKKWLNAEVPPTKRATLHFLSDDEGLIWAEGLGVDGRVRLTEETRRLLVLYVYESDTDRT